MNHFAHALPHLDQPVMMIGTCLLDWLPHARDVVGRHVNQLLNRYPISLAPGT